MFWYWSCLIVMTEFLWKNLMNFLKSFSKILPIIGRSERIRYVTQNALLPFLWIKINFAYCRIIANVGIDKFSRKKCQLEINIFPEWQFWSIIDSLLKVWYALIILFLLALKLNSTIFFLFFKFLYFFQN